MGETRALALLDAALERPSDERAAWLAAHPERAAADRALALLRADGGSLRTGGAAALGVDAPPPERIGAYRITGLIGQGGMGAVYRGERDAGDFEHVVAIKLIRPSALSDTLVERFERERRTLARLAHPHIARLFDGGATPAGEPYIVMELVDGRPLDEWLAGAPPRPARIALFLAICGAVGFAHQNLIVHRDLTPANILVDRSDAPKLIDFGISRPPATAITGADLGGLSLTPGFAAPERLAGLPATTLSDIYSLGVLLARLLPVAGDRDLAAVVDRASAADPAGRYPSADALAEDVRAWRDGGVVAARRGGRGYRLARFVARHRAGVAAGAVALALLLAALAVTLVARARAEAARADAEARFQETRAIAKTLLFEGYDAVSKVPGATQARALLAERGQAYLNALAAQDRAPLDVRIEAGLGLLRLSQVVGGGGDAQLGRLEDAGRLLARSAAILEPLAAAHPSDPAVARAAAALAFEQAATALYNDNDPAKARAAAARIRARLGTVRVHDEESARLVAGAWQAIGDSHGWTNDYAAARAAFVAGERFIAGLPPAVRNATKVRMVGSATARLLGEAHHKLGDEPAARAALDRAVTLNRSLVADAPDDPAMTRKLAISLWQVAVAHRTNKRDRDAATAIDEALAIARELRRRGGGDAASLQLLGQVAEVKAQTLADAGRYAESFRLGDEVVADYRRLAALGGAAPGGRRVLATVLQTRGVNHYAGRDYAGACASWREGHAIFAGLARTGSLSPTDRAHGLTQMATLLARNCDGGPPRAGMSAAEVEAMS